MYKNKLLVCTYSTVRFTLRFVNLFVEVSRVCVAPFVLPSAAKPKVIGRDFSYFQLKTTYFSVK